MEMEQPIVLGGQIELAGFNSLDGGQMIVVKKIVGNYVRKIEGVCKNFSGLKLSIKPLHQTGETMKKFELNGQVIDGGTIYPAGVVENNLFFGVDAVLKKLMKEIG